MLNSLLISIELNKTRLPTPAWEIDEHTTTSDVKYVLTLSGLVNTLIYGASMVA